MRTSRKRNNKIRNKLRRAATTLALLTSACDGHTEALDDIGATTDLVPYGEGTEGAPGPAGHSGTKIFPPKIRLYRVRYKTGAFSSETPDEFRFWDGSANANVPDKHQRHTYIGTMNEPEREDVKHVAIFFAGQQGMDEFNGSGKPNIITGQDKYYKEDCTGTTRSCLREISKNSLAVRVYNENILEESETFSAVVYDTSFNYQVSPTNRDRIESAFFDWISNKFDADNIQTIYLAGSSVGGCLATRLAQEFKEEYPSPYVRVVVSSFDSVCNVRDGDLGTDTQNEDANPYEDSPWHNYKAWNTDMDEQFPNQEGLHMFHISGGEKAIPTSTAHTFSHDDQDVDLGWYRQHWVYETHTDIGRIPETTVHDGSQTLIDAQIEFLRAAVVDPCHELDCDDANPCTVDSCDYVQGCFNLPRANGSWCDDQTDCTSNSSCHGGNCEGDTISGLLACWPFNEVKLATDGTTYDTPELLSGVDSALVGMTSSNLVPGRNGSALTFSGGFVSGSTQSTSVGDGDFSVLFWMKSTDPWGSWFDKRVPGGPGYHGMTYSGGLLMQLYDPSGHYNYTAPAQIADGQWHHVAITIDRDQPQGGRFYRDGSLVGTFNPTGRAGDLDSAAALRIGGHMSSSSQFFNGELDDFMVVGRVLSSGEIDHIVRPHGHL